MAIVDLTSLLPQDDGRARRQRLLSSIERQLSEYAPEDRDAGTTFGTSFGTTFGDALGQELTKVMGYEPPEAKRAELRTQILNSTDPTSEGSLLAAVQAAKAVNDPELALRLASQADALRKADRASAEKDDEKTYRRLRDRKADERADRNAEIQERWQQMKQEAPKARKETKDDGTLKATALPTGVRNLLAERGIPVPERITPEFQKRALLAYSKHKEREKQQKEVAALEKRAEKAANKVTPVDVDTVVNALEELVPTRNSITSIFMDSDYEEYGPPLAQEVARLKVLRPELDKEELYRTAAVNVGVPGFE